MRRYTNTTTLLLLLLVTLAAVTGIQAQESGDLFSRVNNLRASVGRGPYALNGALSAAAQSQAQWIIETGNVGHTRPDGSGPRTRALNAGYPTTQVGENIYGGLMATVDTAWNFWVNSGVHYNGLVNPTYNEVGVGVARGEWGTAYVLVFGNSGGPPPAPVGAAPAVSGGGGNNNGPSSAPAAPPSYVVGVDEYGNIMHEVQAGDTLGDIALIYGYTWDDLPAMMTLNGLTNVEDLEVGSIFLVPRYEGTYTPTPGGPTPTETPLPATRTLIPPSITPYIALLPVREATLIVTPFIILTETPLPEVGRNGIALAAAPPEALLTESNQLTPTPSVDVNRTGTPIAALSTSEMRLTSATEERADAPAARNNMSQWIVIAVVVQVAIVGAAGFEYMRRNRRAKRP